MRRSSKFYLKNEKETMEQLGLKATKASGAGWIEKEDGYNEHILAQLKSTDAESIKVNLQDIHRLDYNAIVAHKLPLFVIQFLQSNETFLLIRPSDLNSINEYLNTGYVSIIPPDVEVETTIKEVGPEGAKVIKSSPKNKKAFWQQKDKEWKEWQKQRKSRA
jgi:hypothetical protein